MPDRFGREREVVGDSVDRGDFGNFRDFFRREVGGRDTTTVPEGYRAPDEYGRMRPEVTHTPEE